MSRTSIGWDEVERAARLLAPHLHVPSGRAPLLLSVDFDMLSGPARPEPGESQQLREARLATFSWQGDEQLDASASLQWWRARSQAAVRSGLDLRDVLDAHNAPSADSLADRLALVHRMPGSSIVVESHVWGAVVARALQLASGGRSARIISLDRHHDLGYINDETDTQQLAEARIQSHVSCDDWLWAALTRGSASSAQVVYGDGTWYDEYLIEQPQAAEDVLARVERLRYSEWNAPQACDALLIVRSGAWSPPWLDETFASFAQRVAPDALWPDADGAWPSVGGMRADQIRLWP